MKSVFLACLSIAALAGVGCSGTPTSPSATLSGAGAVAPTQKTQSANSVTVVGTVNGGGTAEMQEPLAAGSSTFGVNARLFSDGSATGQFDCVDQHGDATGFPGNIFGEVTSWSSEGTVIVLNVKGKFLPIPGGHPTDIAFTVKIQQFGGAGVGRWTLEVDGFIFCYEILTSGQIVYRPAA